MSPRLLGPALVAALVLASGWTDVNRYFNLQMHDASVFAEYSAGPTFAAQAMNALPAGARVLMDERLTGEPTIQFLAPNAPKPEGYETHLLPLTTHSATAIFLGGDQTPDAAYLHALYPAATVRTFSPPYGGPILLHEVLVGQDAVTSIQGLNADYTSAGGAPIHAKAASLHLDSPPVPAPFTADLSGALDAPAFGEYGFRVDAPPGAKLSIDRQPVAEDGKPVQVSLARGVHHLELKAAVTDARQTVQVLWRPPSAPDLTPVPHTSLFSSPAVENGLLGRYYANDTWAGPPSLEEVDPFVSFYYQLTPLPMPFSVEWSGQIATPVAGLYRFNATSIDSSEIAIDGVPAPKETPISLTAGVHDLRLRYEAHSGHNHVELRWQAPGRNWEIVPPPFLFPNRSVSAAQPMPELPPSGATFAKIPAPAQPARLLTPDWQLDLGEGSLPVAAVLDGAGNIYVADAGRRAVVKLDADGHVLWTADAPARTAGFQQLSALALAADGSVLILDGDSGVISRFTAEGQYAGTLAKDMALYHPRGLAVASNGDVYIADTGGSRIVHLNAAGQQLGLIGAHGGGKGGLDQPTGVAVAPDGAVFVADPAAGKVVRFAASGGVEAEWGFGSGPTLNGPKVAMGPDSLIWISDTDGSSLQAFTASGQPEGRYAPDGGLNQPSGFALGNGYVVVAEPGGRLVRKLSLPVPGPAAPPASG